MNQFTSPLRLPFLSDIKRRQEQKINSLINNLKIADVKDDEAFQKTASRIKEQILFKPVIIGDPKFIDHHYEQKPLTIQQQLIGGISSHHYVHVIHFPFTGDITLFSARPEQYSMSSSDRGLIIPYGSIIEVRVDLAELNPENATSQARHLLAMTFQFVEANNASVSQWNLVTEQTIRHLLEAKRQELKRIFGTN